MNAPAIKTHAEQKLEWLEALKRPLTDQESEELRRALHATYCRNLRLAKASRIEREIHAGALEEYAALEAQALREALS